jgi:hypothetical protein
LSVSVRIGATVIESPVWIPIGSMFSTPQTMMQLSFLSRTTSSSNSFHPITDWSICTCPDHARGQAPRHDVAELLGVVRDPPARAAERERRPDDCGQADLGDDASASAKVVTVLDLGIFSPIPRRCP